MMFHSRIEASSAPQPAQVHPQYCHCRDCLSTHDPIGYRRARRVVQWQAVALVACLVAFYAVGIANAPGIAASFGIGQ